MEAETVQVYIRNSQKIGKLLSLPATTTRQELYKQAAAAHNVEPQHVRLYISGKPIPLDQQAISLTEKMIVHLVSLQDTQKDIIEVNVRMLEGRTHPSKIQVSSNSTIRDFIDHKLYKIYGEKSDNLILIHLGRQLNPDSTFQQAEIEDSSELFCVNLVDLREKKIKSKSSLGGKQAEDNHDIYPSRNFPIEVPQEINATSNMDLIFDPTIHHSSSIPDYNLPPDEVIPEEQANLVSAASDREKSNEDKEQHNEREDLEEPAIESEPASEKVEDEFKLAEGYEENIVSTPGEGCCELEENLNEVRGEVGERSVEEVEENV